MKDLFLLATDTCYGIGCAIGDYKSYEKIYKIKSRDYNKPLAIMVADLDWLYDNTSLTEEQLNFISEYNNPYTILTDCPRINMLLDFEDDEISYQNNEIYKKIAFRVAHTPEQKKLIDEVGPIFLTSANYSNMPEIYDIQTLKDTFNKHLSSIEIISQENLNPDINPSDIFEFVGDSLELNYLRK